MVPLDTVILVTTGFLDLIGTLPLEATGVGWILELATDISGTILVLYKPYKEVSAMAKAKGEKMSLSFFINEYLKKKGRTKAILLLGEHLPGIDVLPLMTIANFLGVDLDEDMISSAQENKQNKKEKLPDIQNEQT